MDRTWQRRDRGARAGRRRLRGRGIARASGRRACVSRASGRLGARRAGAAEPGRRRAPRGVQHRPRARSQEIGVRSVPARAPPRGAERPRPRRWSRYDETALVDVSLKVRGWVGSPPGGRRRRAGRARRTCSSRSTAPSSTRRRRSYLQALAQPGASARGRRARARGLARRARPRAAPRALGRLGRATSPRSRGAASRARSCRSARRPAGFVVEKNVVAGGAVEPGPAPAAHRAPRPRVDRRRGLRERRAPACRRDAARASTLAVPARADASTAASPTVLPVLSTAPRARCACASCSTTRSWRCARACGRRVQPARRRRRAPRGARGRPCCTRATRSFVFLDLGGGRYRPRQVELGHAERRRRSRCCAGLEAGRAGGRVGHLPDRRREPAPRRRWSSGERAGADAPGPGRA